MNVTRPKNAIAFSREILSQRAELGEYLNHFYIGTLEQLIYYIDQLEAQYKQAAEIAKAKYSPLASPFSKPIDFSVFDARPDYGAGSTNPSAFEIEFMDGKKFLVHEFNCSRAVALAAYARMINGGATHRTLNVQKVIRRRDLDAMP